MRTLLSSGIFSAIAFLFSCSSSPSADVQLASAVKADSVKRDDFVRGEIIPKIKCAGDSTISYALYLPRTYTGISGVPVIYFFDPHGSGSFPLEKYKDLSEKYGYILAGSNTSKNGMTWEQNGPQVKTFMADVRTRLNINEKRVYACGFSGGSRVAASVGIFMGGINGVIAMGAGLPTITEPIRNRFDYISFAGNEDFNMNELVALNLSLDKSPVRHSQILFNGKHEWASAEIVEDAFRWCEFNAMKDGSLAWSDSLIKKFGAQCNEQARILTEQNDWLGLSRMFKKQIAFLEGLGEVAECKVALDRLWSGAHYKQAARQDSALRMEEFQKQQEYSNAMAQNDLQWWMAEVAVLKGSPKKRVSLEGERALLHKRLLSYLSMLAYMNAKAGLSSKQYMQAEHFVKIYQMVDPENPEHEYMYAELYAVSNRNADALSSLGKAVKLGFKDLVRMQDDPLLNGLRGMPEYKEMESKVSSAR